MIGRRSVICSAVGISSAWRFGAARADTPGVTATDIKIGNTMPYSGPGSAYGVVGHFEAAWFKMVNETGGIAGRRIDFISYDDSLTPPRTVDAMRRLVEDDRVAFIFGSLGTASNAAVVDSLNRKKIPHMFIFTGGSKFGDYRKYPWTIGLVPTYRAEGQVYAKYVLQQAPGAKIAILYLNDDFGKDYVAGFRDVLGGDFDRMVTAASYEYSDPTIDNQITTLQASGAAVFVAAAPAKATAQSIRKVHDMGWRPLFLIANPSTSVGAVLKPAGPEKAVGVISAGFVKDPSDPGFAADPDMQEWRSFMANYLPGADTSDLLYINAYVACKTITRVLMQCEGDFSRENVLRQAENLHGFEVPALLPGISVNTGPADHIPVKTFRLQRWDGASWVRFGELVEGVRES
jgi:branched-chain amino acid transport system substrate-binding protein